MLINLVILLSSLNGVRDSKIRNSILNLKTMGNITVNTIETLATTEFIKSYLMVKHPSLLIGNSGCGKTQLAKGILKEIVQAKPENFAY